MDSITPISSVSPAPSQQIMALVQAQMVYYAHTLSDQSGPISTDLQSLQAAINSGNVVEAQAALLQLESAMRAAHPAATSATPTSAVHASPVENTGAPAPSAPSANPLLGSSLDITI